jgi:hypothetical protein
MISEPGIVNGAAAGPAQAVMQAELALLVAQDQLRTLQEKALLHGGYDPDRYDAAIVAYREARAWAITVRTAWRYWQAEHDRADSLTLR